MAEWEKRNELYIKAEQIILDEGAAPYLVRNVQRWDLPYDDAKAKIDELML